MSPSLSVQRYSLRPVTDEFGMNLVIGDVPDKFCPRRLMGIKPARLFAMMVKVDDDFRGANAQL